ERRHIIAGAGPGRADGVDEQPGRGVAGERVDRVREPAGRWPATDQKEGAEEEHQTDALRGARRRHQRTEQRAERGEGDDADTEPGDYPRDGDRRGELE